MKFQYIEVAYYDGVSGLLFGLKVDQGFNAGQVLDFCGIDYKHYKLGVRGENINSDHVLQDGDRVELYPALRVDPREKRRRLEERRKLIGQKRRAK